MGFYKCSNSTYIFHTSSGKKRAVSTTTCRQPLTYRSDRTSDTTLPFSKGTILNSAFFGNGVFESASRKNEELIMKVLFGYEVKYFLYPSAIKDGLLKVVLKVI